MALPLLPLSIILIFLALKLYQRLRYKLPPGPPRWPVIGNSYDIKGVRSRCFAEWAKVYGPIFSLYLDDQLNIIVNNSELAKEVLKENDQQLGDRFRNETLNEISRNGSNLIWADYGPHYVKVRKVCNLELFSPRRLEDLRPIREDEVSSMVESIFKDCTNNPEYKGKSLLVRNYLMTATTNNTTRLIFGKRFMGSGINIDEQSQKFKGIVATARKTSEKGFLANRIPWLRRSFVVESQGNLAKLVFMNRLIGFIMEEYSVACKKIYPTKQHFLNTLIDLQEKYDLSEDTVIGLSRDMISAGIETVASGVEWAMAELIKNPRVQKKAQEELDRVVGSERVLTESDFANIPYMKCIAKEALRLHPPVPLMLPHKANTNVKIGKYDIPEGAIMHVNVWAIGRDPAMWQDPLGFQPERFLKQDVNVKGLDFRLLPFGAGRRMCPGAQLGINLVTLILGRLLHQFEWTPPEGVNPNDIHMSESSETVTFMQTPLQGVAKPRLPNHLYKHVSHRQL